MVFSSLHANNGGMEGPTLTNMIGPPVIQGWICEEKAVHHKDLVLSGLRANSHKHIEGPDH